MADFTRRRQVTTQKPVLKVDGGLAPGVHTFQLVVKDDSGNKSRATKVRMEIVRVQIPENPVTPVRPVTPVTPTRPVIRRRPRNP